MFVLRRLAGAESRDDSLGGCQPEVAVEAVLGERRVLEREVCEVGDALLFARCG